MGVEPFSIERRVDGVCTVTLDRPEVHNAFDDHLINTLHPALQRLGDDGDVRAVVLTGAGKSFSAGADLGWMRRMASYDEAQNIGDATAMAQLMAILNGLAKPTIAKVNGAALGGGVGLVSACDIAIASPKAVFGTTEVRLGIIPAVIGPYVVGAIGQRQARRLMLTGERIDAGEALRIGLIHGVAEDGGLDDATEAVLADLLKGGPEAIAAAKALILAIADRPITPAMVDDTARRIAVRRASDEGKEGLGAFLDKRAPRWTR